MTREDAERYARLLEEEALEVVEDPAEPGSFGIALGWDHVLCYSHREVAEYMRSHPLIGRPRRRAAAARPGGRSSA